MILMHLADGLKICSTFCGVMHISVVLLVSLHVAWSGIPPGLRNEHETPPEKPQLAPPVKQQKAQPKLAAPPAHLEAVPLERDGKLNKKFKQEVFLGRDTNDVQVDSQGQGHKHDDTDGKDAETLIKELVQKADTNTDGYISVEELEAAVVANIQHHMDESIRQNAQVFAVIDTDGDGVITWDEYHYHFLVDHELMDSEKAKNHDESEHAGMDDAHQDRMELDRDAWQTSDTDGKPGLSEREFLAFRHPEHNAASLKEMVDNILRVLDKDHDGHLSVDEFVAPPPGEVDLEWIEQERKYLNERRMEFSDTIDLNHDGYATEQELMDFVNPRNPVHVKQEVEQLFSLCDEDENKLLTLDELLRHKGELSASGVLNPVNRMHDDL